MRSSSPCSGPGLVLGRRRDVAGCPAALLVAAAALLVPLAPAVPRADAAPPAAGKTANADAPPRPLADVPVVVRLSNRLFQPLQDRPVEDVSGVRQFVFNTDVRGTARTSGLISVKPVPSEKKAAFTVTVTGRSVANTTGRQGPAVIYTHATTDFTATKEVFYDMASGFESKPASVAARTWCRNRGVDSTTGRLIGRIVQAIARRRYRRLLPHINAVARRNAQQRIAAAFDRRVAEILERMNENRYVLEPALDEFRDVSDYEISMNSTDTCVQAAVRLRRAKAPIQLPAADDENHLVQIWLHQSLLRESDRLNWRRDGPRIERALIDLLCAIVDRDDLLHAARSPVQLRRQGDWALIGVEFGPDELGLNQFAAEPRP